MQNKVTQLKPFLIVVFSSLQLQKCRHNVKRSSQSNESVSTSSTENFQNVKILLWGHTLTSDTAVAKSLGKHEHLLIVRFNLITLDDDDEIIKTNCLIHLTTCLVALFETIIPQCWKCAQRPTLVDSIFLWGQFFQSAAIRKGNSIASTIKLERNSSDSFLGRKWQT